MVLVGYMTLTLALPLTGFMPRNLLITSHQFSYGIAILFLMFSLSAISLSSIADLFGSFRVLKFAQPFSIAGLVIIALSYNYWMFYIGFFLMGGRHGLLFFDSKTVDFKTFYKSYFTSASSFLFFNSLCCSAIACYTHYLAVIKNRLAYCFLHHGMHRNCAAFFYFILA